MEVLGRAIQPPDYLSIKYSIKSLLEIGALSKVKHNNGFKLKITDIGKIFTALPLDLMQGRLCLMGYLMGCLHECIVMCCFIQQ